MRYTPGHKQATRKRILETAGALAKQNGFASTGIDSLAAAAGLTGGGFYSHFGSKPDLFKAIIEHELEHSLQRFEGNKEQSLPEWLERSLNRYLSLEHVMHPETGCVLPSLASEIARADDSTRLSYEAAMHSIKDVLAHHIGSEQRAWTALSQCVGAIMLARAMSTEAGKAAILAANRSCLKAILGQAA